MRELFPLPLTSFERVMVLDHQPRFPMAFTMECHFRGQMKRDRLAAALRRVQQRHPLMWARLDRPRSHWVLPAQGTEIPIYEEGSPVPLPDLRSSGGLQVFLASGERSLLRLYCHHACTDGQGCLTFLRDLLQCYHELPSIGTLAPLDVQRLRSREKRPPVPQSIPLARSKAGLNFRIAWDWLFQGPKPLRSHSACAASESPRRALSYHSFSESESRKLTQLAARLPGSFNDLCFVLAFRGLARWQSQRGASPRERLRILMPTSLRVREETCAGSCNRISYAFLTRQLSHCEDWEELYRGIEQETAFIKQHRPDFLMLWLFETLERWRLLGPGLRLPMTFSSAVQTYLNMEEISRGLPRREGRVLVDDLVLKHAMAAAPVRNRTRAAMAICKLGDELTLALRTDSTTFDLEAERELLGELVTSWREFL